MNSDTNTVSDAAKQFIDDAEALEAWCLDTIDTHRAEDYEEAVRTNTTIISKYVKQLETTDIGGVRTLIVTPKNYDAVNDDRRVLYFFGGAFVVGSPDVDLPIIARLATRLNTEVLAPYYRLAPEHACPAAIDDGFAVYREVIERISPGRVALVGESAGGNLSLAVTLRAREQGVELPAALALMSPWCDVTPTGEAQQQPAGFDPTLDYELHLREPAAAYAGDYDQKDPRVSPLYADFTGGFPATIITTGTRELFRSDCERLATIMQQAEIDVRLRIWEGMWHTFEWYVDIPEADQSMDEIADFIRKQLSGN